MPTDSCCPKCDALREVEWTPTDGDDDRCDDRCPGCFNYYEQGHAKPCRLAAALAAPCAVKLMREAADRIVDPNFERVLRDILEAVEGGRPARIVPLETFGRGHAATSPPPPIISAMLKRKP